MSQNNCIKKKKIGATKYSQPRNALENLFHYMQALKNKILNGFNVVKWQNIN